LLFAANLAASFLPEGSVAAPRGLTLRASLPQSHARGLKDRALFDRCDSQDRHVSVDEQARDQEPEEGAAVQEREARLWIAFQDEPQEDEEPPEAPNDLP